MTLLRRLLRFALSLGGVALITWVGYSRIPLNATTQGFVYLMFVLAIASTWGFLEAAIGSLAATLLFNFFFFEPKLTLTIVEPQNWVALFSFLATSLVASRLSTKARQRAADALERQRDLERLYTFGRAILLSDNAEPFPKQLARRLAETFELEAVALYELRSGEMYNAGPLDFDGMESQIREAGLQGTIFSDATHKRVIIGVRLGSLPLAGLALQGKTLSDSVLQSIANLVAIGLERARAQEFAQQVEVSKRSEELRTTLIDAMAHEFKTPLTSIRAATSSLSSGIDLNTASASRLWKIADEEAAHLEELIDNALDVARLDTNKLELDLKVSDLAQIVEQVLDSMQGQIENRHIEIKSDASLQPVLVDQRLTKLAIKQILSNALKYSPHDTPIMVRMFNSVEGAGLEITDYGKGISEEEQRRVFDRFYRSSGIRDQIPGSGLGLSIAKRILQTHEGRLSVKSQPGETTFRMELPGVAKKELV